MNDKKGNFLVRVWRGFWNGLTAFRIAVFNILFLIVLALVVRMLLGPGDAITVEEDSTLVIAPKGLIVEQYTGSPSERALNEALGQQLPETRLRDIVRALELAAEDDDITQVLIGTDRLLGVAPGTFTELAAAFDKFRQTGKPVYAYGSSMGQSTYGLASLADEVWLNPDGTLMIEGYAYYRNYFREGLEKLRVDVNLFRVGEFKSAMEPFIRDSMSEADRAAAEYFITGLWREYLDIVAGHRGIPVERLLEITEDMVALLEDADGNPGEMALEAGLADRLLTRPAARAELASTGAPDKEKGFRQIGMRSYLKVPRKLDLDGDRVGIIVAQGAITEGDQPPGTIGSESLSKLLRKARRDDDLEAVVLRIDSGGGSAFASEVIRQEMLALKESGKPVVVSMANVAASGGYWIAMGADEVWAYPNTITGSIGIFGFLPTFQDSLDAIGVHTDGFGVTPLAGAFRVDRELPESARRVLQSVIEHGYEQFIELVAEYRGKTTDEVDDIAQGRVWTGTQARDRGLVDQLGTLEEAVAAAARIAGIAERYDTVYVAPSMSPFERFFADMGARALAWSGLERAISRAAWWPGNDLYRRMLGQFAEIEAASSARRPAEPMAHCLCEPPM
ncbi:MAG: signal peptide peptidase SppA [Wenzhouxiangellaceae bacterium]|nr:signal peptide peptidase SppA [Wenzhouxiangellaceae bacterium]MBS3745848.1 signal peptide peptidase SppA [Wenzhouxiangellaceae bacterium]MBS3824343.1 signal peptide peptidase SppA [Wenzhouxiangellaceae bacterium]